MAITKSAVTVLTSASIAAGGTKASPSSGGSGSSIDCTTYYGGEITWKMTNGTAPGVAMTITIQASNNNGTSWFDYYTVTGDIVASSINSGSIVLDRGVMYIRALAYGNTTNAVTAEVLLHAVTAV